MLEDCKTVLTSLLLVFFGMLGDKWGSIGLFQDFLLKDLEMSGDKKSNKLVYLGDINKYTNQLSLVFNMDQKKG